MSKFQDGGVLVNEKGLWDKPAPSLDIPYLILVVPNIRHWQILRVVFIFSLGDRDPITQEFEDVHRVVVFEVVMFVPGVS